MKAFRRVSQKPRERRGLGVQLDYRFAPARRSGCSWQLTSRALCAKVPGVLAALVLPPLFGARKVRGGPVGTPRLLQNASAKAVSRRWMSAPCQLPAAPQLGVEGIGWVKIVANLC